MSIFKNKIQALKSKVEQIKSDAEKIGRFSLFHTKYATEIFKTDDNYEGLLAIYNILQDNDKDTNIPFEHGLTIDAMVNDPSYTLCIKKAELGFDTKTSGLQYNEKLIDNMHGLYNYGHINEVGIDDFSDGLPDISLAMTPITTLTGYINLFSNHHNNDTIIFAAFPSYMVDREGHISDEKYYKEIYDITGKIPRIKEQYMIGALLIKDINPENSNQMDELYSRDCIINYNYPEKRSFQ